MNTFLTEADQSAKAEYEKFASTQLLKSQPIASFFEGISEQNFLSREFLHLVLLVEAIASYDPSLAAALVSHLVVTEFLKKFGNESQTAKKKIAAVAVFESEKERLPMAVSSNFEQSGPDGTISGSKRMVLNGEDAQSFLVLAQSKGTPFYCVVDASPSIKKSPEQSLLGFEKAGLSKITFEKAKLAGDQLISGDVNEQFEYQRALENTLLGGLAIGILSGALRQSAAYARESERDGAPVAQSQGMLWKLADLATEGQAARLMVYRAAWNKDQDTKEFQKNAAMCKALATRVARIQSGEAIQVVGLLQADTSVKLGEFYKDAKMLELMGSTSEQQKVLIGSELGI